MRSLLGERVVRESLATSNLSLDELMCDCVLIVRSIVNLGTLYTSFPLVPWFSFLPRFEIPAANELQFLITG